MKVIPQTYPLWLGIWEQDVQDPGATVGRVIGWILDPKDEDMIPVPITTNLGRVDLISDFIDHSYYAQSEDEARQAVSQLAAIKADRFTERKD